MANNQSIQFLRGTAARKAAVGSSTVLLAGQPFFETDTNRLYIGDGSKTLSTLSAISAYYDTVIASQEDFEEWCKGLGSYTGHSVVFLHGTYIKSDRNGLHLPDTLYTIKGIGQVSLEIPNFYYNTTSNKGGIWYTNTPTGIEYSIENISVTCTGSTGPAFGVGFYNCTNLTACTVVAQGHNDSYAFQNCTNLVNCRCLSTSSGYGFSNCTNLTDCTASSSYYAFSGCNNLTNCTGTGASVGFGGCKYLVNCICDGLHEDRNPSTAFKNCNDLTNCYGYAKSYGFSGCNNLTNCTGCGNDSYGFYDCSVCSNCKQDTQYKSGLGTWGGANKNVDPNTCLEYKT